MGGVRLIPPDSRLRLVLQTHHHPLGILVNLQIVKSYQKQISVGLKEWANLMSFKAGTDTQLHIIRFSLVPSAKMYLRAAVGGRTT
jgi:hypothetical protein